MLWQPLFRAAAVACPGWEGYARPAEDQKMTLGDWPALASYPVNIRRMFDDLRSD